VLHSLITDGCMIEGTVEYSVLSPGVRVERGAVVRYSIIMTDAVIRAGAMVDRCIVDKQVEIGAGAQVGYGMDYTPNRTADLSSGITLVGKNAVIPPNIRIGRNCIIAGDVYPQDFTNDNVPSGSVVGIVGE
jgi:glucose-1-phosphate adenylyltransferase